MIKEESFELGWIKSFNEKPQRANPEIIEKEIYALKLLELLVETKLDFIFKGGTCLSLILQEFTRYSIDIDISVNVQENKIESYLEKLKLNNTFVRYEEQNRKKIGSLIKRHFKFYYWSKHNNREDYVLLDVVFEQSDYSKVIETHINFPLLKTEEPHYVVKTPDLENILIDKLTAFAPYTIGITYESGKYIEVVKQMYDVSKISKLVNDSNINVELYEKMAKKQILNRNLSINSKDTLSDTIIASLNILTKGEYGNKNRDELTSAINGFKGYVFGNKFTYIDAEEAAIDALYVATIIYVDGHEEFIKLLSKDLELNDLNKFKKVFKSLKGNHRLNGQFIKLEKSLKVLKAIKFNL